MNERKGKRNTDEKHARRVIIQFILSFCPYVFFPSLSMEMELGYLLSTFQIIQFLSLAVKLELVSIMYSDDPSNENKEYTRENILFAKRKSMTEKKMVSYND